MRHLLAFLAVSAFALLAVTAQAVCPSDIIEAASDCDLPVEGDTLTFNPYECMDEMVDWDWYFTRTGLSTGRTVVFAGISNTTTTVFLYIRSSAGIYGYPIPGNYYRSGSGSVTGSFVWSWMWLHPSFDDCGHFTNLEFSYTTR